jgi:ATP-dependent protease ClpP protease subunit
MIKKMYRDKQMKSSSVVLAVLAASSQCWLSCSFITPSTRQQWLRSTATTVASASAAVIMTAGATGDGESADSDDGTSTVIDRRDNKVFFYGDISGESCRVLRRTLDDVAQEILEMQSTYGLSAPAPIELHVQSPGGAVMPTFAVVDYIRRCPVPIHSYVEGYAASAATLITCSCSKRFMYGNGLMLLHQLSGGAQGKFAEMNEQLKNAELMMTMIEAIYADNTMMTPEDIADLLSHDKWMGAKECLARGIVDAII